MRLPFIKATRIIVAITFAIYLHILPPPNKSQTSCRSSIFVLEHVGDLGERFLHHVLRDVQVERQPELVEAEGNAPDRKAETEGGSFLVGTLKRKLGTIGSEPCTLIDR